MRTMGSSIAIVLANAVLVSAALGAAALTPARGSHVAVMVSPLSPPDRAAAVVAAAGGSLVAGTTAPWIVVANSDETDFIARLYEAGAMTVLNADAAFSCDGKGRETE